MCNTAWLLCAFTITDYSFIYKASGTVGKTSTDAGGTVSQLPASEGEDTGSDSGNNGNASGTGGDSGINASGTGSGRPAQAPFADSEGRENVPSSTGSAAGASGSGSKKPYSSPGSNTPAASGNPHAEANSPDNPGSASPLAQDSGKPIVGGSDSESPNGASRPSTGSYDNPVPSQQVALSRAGLPTAAIAVPLSLLGATLIASLGLCIVHRRSLAAQRAKNAHLIEVQRNASVRTVESKVPSLADSTSRSALIEDPDIEKAIDALCGYERRRTRQASLDRESSAMHEPTSTRYPIPRQDVRRERTRTYERAYERPYELPCNFTRTDSDRLAPSPRSRCHSSSYPRSPIEDHERSFHTYHRCNSGARGNRYGWDQDEDVGASTTDTILSSYYPPRIPPRRLPRHHSFYARPKLPDRSHSRCTAPAMDYSRYHHDNDGAYDPVSSPHARSHRSW